MMANTGEYPETVGQIKQIKQQARAAQYKEARNINVELILLLHRIGCAIHEHKA